jgi:hypothetical protein
MLVAVAVGTEVIRIPGLPVVAAVAAILAIVLAVLQTPLKKLPRPMLIFVAVLVLVAILILALLCGSRASKTGRTEPGEGNSKCQHP